MILIVSTENGEASTADVMDWLHAKGASFCRMNGEQLQQASLNMTINNTAIQLSLGEQSIPIDGVKLVWLRRSGKSQLPKIEEGHSNLLSDAIRQHSRTELRSLKRGIWAMFYDKEWLTRPDQLHINKLEALQQAQRLGFRIPDSLVTTNQSSLLAFKAKHQRLIAKSLDVYFSYYDSESWIVQYTHEVDEDFIHTLPTTFFPSLFQAYIEKVYELRIFYFDGQTYPMAIFSQKNTQTALDFRHYDSKRPNRTVPYRLPELIEQRVHDFMKAVDLQTGSLDLIRTPQGEYVFLEVNPVGQFGMVSYPCNYHLEEKIADWLAARG